MSISIKWWHSSFDDISIVHMEAIHKCMKNQIEENDVSLFVIIQMKYKNFIRRRVKNKMDGFHGKNIDHRRWAVVSTNEDWQKLE